MTEDRRQKTEDRRPKTNGSCSHSQFHVLQVTIYVSVELCNCALKCGFGKGLAAMSSSIAGRTILRGNVTKLIAFITSSLALYSASNLAGLSA